MTFLKKIGSTKTRNANMIFAITKEYTALFLAFRRARHLHTTCTIYPSYNNKFKSSHGENFQKSSLIGFKYMKKWVKVKLFTIFKIIILIFQLHIIIYFDFILIIYIFILIIQIFSIILYF